MACGNDHRGGLSQLVLTLIRAPGGEPFAILAQGPYGRYIIPPIVVGPDGEAATEMPVEITRILLGETPAVEVPVLHLREGDRELARIDQTLALLRDQHGADPWPPLGDIS